MAQVFEEIKKYNHNHGDDGKFTSGTSSVSETGNDAVLAATKKGWNGREAIGKLLSDAKKGSTISYKETDTDYVNQGAYIQEKDSPKETRWTKTQNGMWSGVEQYSDGHTQRCINQSDRDLGMIVASVADHYYDKQAWPSKRFIDPEFKVDMK